MSFLRIQHIKGAEYINIEKVYKPNGILYKCYAGSREDIYQKLQLLYVVRFSNFHKGIVYNEIGSEIGNVQGRSREWYYSPSIYYDDDLPLHVTLYDFPTLNASFSNIHVNIDDAVYKSEKPRPKGWNDLHLDFGYLNKCMSSSKNNFKLMNQEGNLVMMSCKLLKNNSYHCVSNLHNLHSFLIFCIKDFA